MSSSTCQPAVEALTPASDELTDGWAQYLVPRRLTHQERRWVDEYCIDFNRKRANAVAGYSKGPHERPAVKIAVEQKLEEYTAVSKLQAEYVRDYIHSVLEFHPTDYFQLDESGAWVIDPAQFRQLPPEVKRLVEKVESRVERGRLVFTVVFLSKTAALALAARYTLTEQHDHRIAVLPWEKVVEAVERVGADSVEARLRGFDGPEGVAGPVQAESGAVA